MRGVIALLAVGTVGIIEAQAVPSYVTSPLLSIGDSTTGPTRFTGLADAKRSSDGRVVVASCGDRELRSFDSMGKHLATLSLSDNPRESRSLWRLLEMPGDTLVAVQSLFGGRLSFVSRELKLLRSLDVPNPDGGTRPSMLDVIGRYSDGSFVGRLNMAPPAPRVDTLWRRPVRFFHFDATGALLDSMAMPGADVRVIPTEPRVGAVRLARMTVAAVLPDRIVFGDQAIPALRTFSPAFKPLGEIPTATRPVAINDSIKRAFTEAGIARVLFPVNGILPAYGDFYPESTPAYRDIVAGKDERIWVQDPHGADFYPLNWTAYRDAKPVARLSLPPRFYPTQFGTDWVLGLAFDTTTVERVALLKMTRGITSDQRMTPKDAAPTNKPRCGAWVSR